jgi:flagellar biosynthetic protein FliO
MKKILVMLGIPLCLSIPVWAWADPMDFINKGTSSGPNFAGLLIKLVLSLVLIVGLIYVSMYFLKRLSFTTKKRLGGSDIEVLQRTYIAPKKGIYIVRVQSKILVLGITDNNINLLTELPELTDEKGNPQNPFSNPGNKNKSFSELMQEMKNKFDSLWQKRGKNAV